MQGDKLELSQLRGTEAACPTQALFQQEQLILGLLQTLERFELSGERLTLHSERGQVLIFNLYREWTHY